MEVDALGTGAELQSAQRACVAGVLATGKIDAYEIRSPAGLGARWYSVSVGPILVGNERGHRIGDRFEKVFVSCR